MNSQETFFLSPTDLDRYQNLTFRNDAHPVWNCIPFSTMIWDDEHPLRENGLQNLPADERFCHSIIHLVIARTAIWIQCEVPEELQLCWEETKITLPGWPGFNRLSLTDEEKKDVIHFQEQLDEFEGEIISEAYEASRSIDKNGIAHINVTRNLKKEKGKTCEGGEV